MNTYSIRSLEALTGIKAATIRMWEKRYNLFNPQRSETKIRFYTENDLKKLLLISILQRNGYKISEIAKLSDQELQERALILFTSENIFNGDIEMLIYALKDFDAKVFDKIIFDLILSFGFEKTFHFALLPFLFKLEFFYNEQFIDITHRNFAFYLIEKIMFSILRNFENSKAEKTFVLFTDTSKLNFFVLLYAYFVLLKRKKSVIFLGNIENIADLFEHLRNFETKFFVTTSYKFKQNNQKLIEFIKENFDLNFYVLDVHSAFDDYELPNFFWVNDISEFDAELT